MTTACRLCLSSSASHYKAIAAIEEKYFQSILPEIDIQLVQSPMFCQSCIGSLQASYLFKSNCIETEKMLKLYSSNCGGRKLLLSDVLQNNCLKINPIQSDNNHADAPLNKGITAECDNDSFGCDLDLAGDDSQSCPKIEIKLNENEINFGSSQRLALYENTSKESDEDNKKIDEIIDYKKPFQCEDCGNSFSKRKLLIDHVKKHYERPHCFSCDRTFSNRHGLKRHLLNVHKIEMSENYDEQFYTMYPDKEKLDECLQKHLELYKGVVDVEGGENADDEETLNRHLKCKICGKGYNKKKILLGHIRIHFTKSDCKLCEKQFYNVAALKRHLQTMHQIDVSDDVTWQDNITVVVDVPKMEEALKEHSKLKEMDDGENKSDPLEDKTDLASEPSEFPCQTCGKQFRGKLSLKRHKLVYCGKPSICDYCHKGFLTKVKLETHISACHQGIRRKRTKDCNFVCDTCGFSTTNKWTLVGHIRVHTGERPFKCNLCDNAFAQNSTLHTHMRTVHSTERIFTCEYCSRSFKLKGALTKHILDVHMVDKIEKKFICNYCGKKYRLQSRLNSHLKWHKSDRPFSCDLCKKTFVSKHSLKKHRVTHFAEKKHKCEICGKGFHQKSNIKIHMKVHGTFL